MHKPHETLSYKLEILIRLSHTPISAPDLHAKLESAGIHKSYRGLQRQLGELCEQFPHIIERDTRSKPYGYRIQPNSAGFNLPTLTPEQALVLKLAKEQVEHLLPKRIANALEPFFAHAQHQLTFDPKNRLEKQWTKKTYILPETQRLLEPEIDAGVFEKITTALYHNYVIDIVYQKSENAPPKTHYFCLPLGLLKQGVREYVVVKNTQLPAHFEPMVLALHRIQSVVATTISAEPPADFNLKRFAEEQFGYGSKRPIRLTFSTEKDNAFILKETPLSQDQILEKIGENHYRVQATVQETYTLERWLNSYGKQIWNVESVYLD